MRTSAILACFMVMTAASLRGQSSSPSGPAASQNHSRLSTEKSPYLLEHAHDLVDWHPWSAEAFAEAKKENKLIFLSIGYSSCHWCHVMQREDFENPQVAQLMNRFFISILVDREERPEVDNQYLAVCEMLTGSGGWPLNVIMTPDRKPFFASTYLPNESEPGRTGMIELIPEIEQKWKTNPAQIMNGGEKLAKLLERNLDRDAPGPEIGAAGLKAAVSQLASSFDSRNGGFVGAPKFPPALDILFLLRAWKRDGDGNALKMAQKTLDAMRDGAIFDQVGYGFHRYATDAEWRAPHFEKMLYDQALLAMAYTEAYQATRQPRYETTARQIFAYVLRDLTSPDGAFYDAQDADSGGAEGGYYLWTEHEIQEALDPAAAGLIVKAFDVRKHGNFPGTKNGENILYWRESPEALAEQMKMPADELRAQVQAACARLLAARQRRPHPQIDEKIMTGWNGLMIAAFAKAAQAFGDPQYAQTAARAADFLLNRARTSDGRLLHVDEEGEAAIPGNLNDYAFLTWGLLELYESDFRLPYLQAAVNLDSQLVKHFWDSKRGGFFFTADDDQNHLVREKNIDDIELPSGNAVEILNLLRLSDMTGQTALMEKALQTEKAFAGAILKDPAEYPETLAAADYALGPSYEVVIAGNSKAAATQAMLKAADAPFLPDKVVLLRPTENQAPGITRLADYTRYESGVDGGPTAYVCLKYNCKLPTNDTGKMLQLLGAK